MLNYFIINTPSVRFRRTATPFKKGELKAKTSSLHTYTAGGLLRQKHDLPTIVNYADDYNFQDVWEHLFAYLLKIGI